MGCSFFPSCAWPVASHMKLEPFKRLPASGTTRQAPWSPSLIHSLNTVLFNLCRTQEMRQALNLPPPFYWCQLRPREHGVMPLRLPSQALPSTVSEAPAISQLCASAPLLCAAAAVHPDCHSGSYPALPPGVCSHSAHGSQCAAELVGQANGLRTPAPEGLDATVVLGRYVGVALATRHMLSVQSSHCVSYCPASGLVQSSPSRATRTDFLDRPQKVRRTCM